jgi:internalin A
MGMEHPQHPLVFISFSHEDNKWVELLLTHLKPLKDRNLLDCWSDRDIDSGAEWQMEIEQALASAKVAVLLVSPYFLASDFIAKKELPPILDKTSHKQLTILWIAISDSNFKYTEINKYQAAHNPEEPLDTLPESQQHTVFRKLSDQIMKATAQNSGR